MIDKAIEAAIETFKNGGVVIYPTDTIWGIGCDATDEQACLKINEIKNRPATKSFIVLVDSVIRLLPGVLNDETSALTDSFQDNLLSPPVYTRPPEFRGLKVPDVLMSGNFEHIEQYRESQALQRTKERRPDLLDNYGERND